MQFSKTGYLLFKTATIYVSELQHCLISKATTNASMVISKIFCEKHFKFDTLYIHADYNCLGQSSRIVPLLEM